MFLIQGIILNVHHEAVADVVVVEEAVGAAAEVGGTVFFRSAKPYPATTPLEDVFDGPRGFRTTLVVAVAGTIVDVEVGDIDCEPLLLGGRSFLFSAFSDAPSTPAPPLPKIRSRAA
jgi:hypothetical protein